MKNYLVIVPTALICLCQCSERKQNEKSAQLVNEDTAVVANAANIFYETDRFSDALIEYQKLVKYDSLNPKVCYRLGFCLTNVGKYEEGIAYLKKAAILNYRAFDCYYLIGLTYYLRLFNEVEALYYFRLANDIRSTEELKMYIDKLSRGDGVLL